MIDSERLSVAPPSAWAVLRSWPRRTAWFAVAASLGVALLIGLPTDVIPNPVFGRPVPVTWWSYPTLAISAVLGGVLAASYLASSTGSAADPRSGTVPDDASPTDLEHDTPTRVGGAAGLLSFFAVGCPVCNKLVIIAVGATGARQWFEPVQPLLAIAAVGLLAWAVRVRLRSAAACPVTR